MKQSDISSSSTTSSKQCGCSPSSTPVVGSFQFANISSFGMGTGCPSFAELNTLQQQLIDMQNAHESGQVQGFNADYAQKIGGYPKTALVSDPNDPTRLFISKADDNTADPTKDTTGAWFPLTDTLTATRDAIAKEEQRARSAEAALQPKGDYATNESLNVETERAKSIEATLQPKGDYATQHDLSAETQRAQSAEAALQPKGDYATNESLNAETERAKTVEATLQPRGDYATHKDLSDGISSEEERAKEAESKLQPAGDYATNDALSAETNRAKSVEATLQPRGDYATNDALSAETSRAKAAEATFQPKGDYATTKGLSDGIAAETERAKAAEAVLQPKGNYALNNDLTSEVERAKTAEETLDQNKVNRAGDTMSGDLIIEKRGDWENYTYGGKFISTISGYPENSFLQAQRVNGQSCAVVGVEDAQQKWHTWYFNANNGSLSSPSGNSIPEVVGSQGRTVIQAWKVKCKNHDWISFPQEFLGKPISLQLTAEHTPNSAPSICVGYYEATQTAQGFEVDLRWLDDNSSGSQTDPITVNILAIGPM